MGNPFGISHREVDERTCLVTVEGDLDLSCAPLFKWTLLELLERDFARYVIDLSELTYMDSTGLGVLVGVRKQLHGGAELALCVPAKQRRLFELTGLDACFDSFGTLEEALNAAPSLPLRTDAAIALGLAATAMPFAASRRAEVLRWLRILRLHGEAARVLCALGVGETPLPSTDAVEPEEAAEASAAGERTERDPVAAVSELAMRLARKRGAGSVGTDDVLLAVMRFYGPDFDRVLTAHGTDRDEVISRLAA
jgi:anti-sigma B factor antagonist